MSSTISLECLTTEILLKIFLYLEPKDIIHLKQTCKRFKDIVLTWDNIFFKNLPTPLATNQINDEFTTKCIRKLSDFDKIRISINWMEAKYTESPLLFTKRKFLPYLQMSNKYLWISRGSNINCYERGYHSLFVGIPVYVLRGKSKADVVNFHVKNDIMVTGLRDGTMWIKDLNSSNGVREIETNYTNDVHSVALNNNASYLASGSRDGTVTTWKIKSEDSYHSVNEEVSVSYADVIWKLAFSNDNKLAVGTGGQLSRRFLLIRNLERTNVEDDQVLSCRGGIHDIIWDGPHTLWACGYDSFLRMWDIRTGKAERNFLDPCGSGLYCIDYDFHNTIITGAQMNGRVVLWDIRKGSAIQMYFMDTSKKRYNKSTPIYSLAFDAEFMFAATDQNLHVLDFSRYDVHSKDYSFFLKKGEFYG